MGLNWAIKLRILRMEVGVEKGEEILGAERVALSRFEGVWQFLSHPQMLEALWDKGFRLFLKEGIDKARAEMIVLIVSSANAPRKLNKSRLLGAAVKKPTNPY